MNDRMVAMVDDDNGEDGIDVDSGGDSSSSCGGDDGDVIVGGDLFVGSFHKLLVMLLNKRRPHHDSKSNGPKS